MITWISRSIAGACAILLFAVAACATAEPAGGNGSRIIAIGDLHGDYSAYEELLTQAGLIDDRGRWDGGSTILVQLGDIPDRGPDTAKIIRHLKKLQKRAPKDDGQVITLIGNHEAMNMVGDLRYVHPGEYAAFADKKSEGLRDQIYAANIASIEEFYLGQDPAMTAEAMREEWNKLYPLGRIEHQIAWRADGEFGKWVAQNPAVAIVGDSLFVHGGVSEKYTQYAVDEINQMVSAELTAETPPGPDSVITDPMGPLWYRGLISRAEPETEEDKTNESDDGAGEDGATPTPPRLSIEDEIALVLQTYGVNRIVVAHTPSLVGIRPSHGAKLIQIDTGNAAHYGGTRSYLEIINGEVIAHDNGIATPITAESHEGATP